MGNGFVLSNNSYLNFEETKINLEMLILYVKTCKLCMDCKDYILNGMSLELHKPKIHGHFNHI